MSALAKETQKTIFFLVFPRFSPLFTSTSQLMCTADIALQSADIAELKYPHEYGKKCWRIRQHAMQPWKPIKHGARSTRRRCQDDDGDRHDRALDPNPSVSHAINQFAGAVARWGTTWWGRRILHRKWNNGLIGLHWPVRPVWHVIPFPVRHSASPPAPGTY